MTIESDQQGCKPTVNENETRFAAKGMAKESFRFGEHFTAGAYLVQVMQGDSIKIEKVIKGR